MIVDENITENSKINKLNYNSILDFFTTISNELEQTGFTSLLDFRNYKFYKKSINYQEVDELELELENKLVLEHIKKLDDKIEAFIKNKKEFEYLSDYFVTSTNKNFNFELINEEGKEENDEIFLNNFSEEIKEIEQNKIDLNSEFISNVLSITSHEFLKNKIKLEANQIFTIKGKQENCEINDNLNISKNDINQITYQNTCNLISSSQKNYLDVIPYKYPSTSKRKNLRGSTTHQNELKNQIDKEVEEEVNEEIFSYAKNMKNYARNFNQILVKDNSKLGKIESVQDISKSKTDKSLKSVKDFNNSATIGFFYLLIMFLIVIATFVMTLLTIRIFPKLVN
jgi:hypothetical protein